jgi:hypothetical protein
MRIRINVTTPPMAPPTAAVSTLLCLFEDEGRVDVDVSGDGENEDDNSGEVEDCEVEAVLEAETAAIV